METTHLNNLSYEEKYKLATNEGTPAEILAVLAKDKIYTIRRGVALNESTKSETLAMLQKIGMNGVFRRAVAATEIHLLIYLLCLQKI